MCGCCRLFSAMLSRLSLPILLLSYIVMYSREFVVHFRVGSIVTMAGRTVKGEVGVVLSQDFAGHLVMSTYQSLPLMLVCKVQTIVNC